MSHRLECGMPTSGLKMAVIVQVNAILPSYTFTFHWCLLLAPNTDI